MQNVSKTKNGFLNRYFKYEEQGSTIGNEISSGIIMGILSVCGIFMNVQLMAQLQLTGPYATTEIGEAATNGEVIAQMYFISMILAFAGSLLIGIVARLPLVQTSSLGLGTVLISIVGSANGLTYYNILAISLISSVVCTLILLIPGISNKIWNLIPNPVKRAAPAATGIILVWAAMQLTGLVTVQPSALSTYGVGAVIQQVSSNVNTSSFVNWSNFSYATDKFHPLMVFNAVSVLVAFGVYLYTYKRNRHPIMMSLLSGTLFFLLTNICFVSISWKNFGVSLDSFWGRLWAIGSEDAYQHHFFYIISHFSPGKVLSEGFDFSTYISNGGNAGFLIFTGVLNVALTLLLDSQATLMAIHIELNTEDNKIDRKSLLCNTVFGVVAPLVGSTPLSVSKVSYAGVKDGARSGLSSVVASFVQLISAFIWVIPFLFVTLYSYDIKFTMYGHYGEVLHALSECSFAVVDAVMVIVGVSMIISSMNIEWKQESQSIPFIVTVLSAFFMTSLVAGVATGTIAYLLVTFGKKDSKHLTINQLILGLFCIILLYLFTR